MLRLTKPRFTRYIPLVAAGVIATVFAVDCSDGSADPTSVIARTSVATVSMSLNAATLTVGQSSHATVVAKNVYGAQVTGETITWSSLDPAVATVSSSGLVTAVAPGTTTIRATIDATTADADVTVKPVPVASVSVSLAASPLTAGQTTHVAAVAKDSSGDTLSGRAITWSSADTTVATVSSSGVVTAVAAGQTSIQATLQNIVSSAVVTVSAAATVASVTVVLNPSSVTPGQTTQATAVAKDAGGNVLTGLPVSWSSLNPAVATVSSTGLVTTVAAGQTSIQATVQNVVGSAAVTVTAPAAVATVTVVLSPSSVTVGQAAQATAVARDASGNVLTGRTLTWTSMSPSIASISSVGLVTTLAAGTATIQATVGTTTGTGSLVVTAAPTGPSTVVLPALPLYYVDTHPGDMPSPGTAHHVHSGDDLQAAINAAAPGDSIVLDPGAMFVGNYTLPAKIGASASKWITITTAGVSVAEGTRMTPSMASSLNLAHIRAANTMDGLQAVSGASYYRISGLELDVDPAASITYSIVEFSPGSQYINADHLYVHGTSTSPIVRGVLLNGAWLGVTDSYISDIHGNNFDSQAVAGWTGPGPYKIVNNYLEAAGENIMFGGSDPSVVGQTPADIEIRGNHMFKPLTWGTTWTIKNLLELKDAQRVLIEGNLLENCWAAGQSGYAIVMQAVSQQDTAPWSTVADITFRYNYVTNATSGATINSRTSGQLGRLPTNPSQRILFENNVFDRIGIDPVLGAAAGNGNMMTMLSDLQNVTIRHNSLIGAASINAAVTMGSSGGLGPQTALIVRDNIIDLGLYGLIGSGIGVGTAALNAFAPGGDVQGNVFFAHPSNPYGSWGSPSNYPANNSFANSSTDVGFTSFSTGDYTLSGSSAFRGKATDGLDPGADIATVNSKISVAR